MWIKLAERLEAKDRTKIRNVVGATNHVPINFVDGDEPPKIYGSRGGWFTRGGTPIRYPSAYSKNGFSNMVYETSTLNIVVGKRFKVS